MGAVGGKDQARLIGMSAAADSKPPSLAGVEKFIRAKVATDVAKTKLKVPPPPMAAAVAAKGKAPNGGVMPPVGNAALN